MTGLANNQILAMVGMGAVPINCDNPAYSTMIKGEGPEMLGQQDDR